MSRESEISVRIENASGVHDYCRSLGGVSVEEFLMERRVYKNGSGMMARYTVERYEGGVRAYFDFKQDAPGAMAVKTVRETFPLTLREDQEEAFDTFIKSIGYTLSVELVRKRTRYVAGSYHIDVDEYTSPEQATVLEVEGDPNAILDAYAALRASVDGVPEIA